MAVVAITRMDHTAQELRAAAKRSDDVAAARRMLALALVLEGKSRYGVKLAERSVGDLLRRLGFRRISVRPRCPEQDTEAQEAHKKTFPIWSLPLSPRMRRASRSSSGGRTRPASASRAR